MNRAAPSDLAELAVEVHAETFFQEAVTVAIEQRRAEASPASTAYLVALLADHARGVALLGDDEPFGLRLARAMQTSGGERFLRLRALGDDVLFFSGFFAQHLERRGVDLDYAAGLGQVAYGGAASVLRGHSRQTLPVFEELAERFTLFVSLLQDVSDGLQTRAARDQLDILALYERWARSRSDVLARELAKVGLIPHRKTNGLN
ncbi:MAG TPA: hypothetical protein VHM70_09650 [Polyangiaceae bacterium]|jgi:hypothetical protein|nr:hypothetical protein [Polyangiaceae bacterium]